MRLNRYITLPTNWDEVWPKMKENCASQREKELNCSGHEFAHKYVEITDHTGMNLVKPFPDWVEKPILGKYCVHCGRYKEL